MWTNLFYILKKSFIEVDKFNLRKDYIFIMYFYLSIITLFFLLKLIIDKYFKFPKKISKKQTTQNYTIF